MKLYDVPNNTWIVVDKDLRLFFHHVDGAFSHCTDKDNNVVHLSTWTDVEIDVPGEKP